MFSNFVRNYATKKNMFTLTKRATQQIEKLAEHHQTKNLQIVVSGSTVFGYRYKINPITYDSNILLDCVKHDNFNLHLCDTTVMCVWDSNIDWYHRDSEEDSSELNGEGFIDC